MDNNSDSTARRKFQRAMSNYQGTVEYRRSGLSDDEIDTTEKQVMNAFEKMIDVRSVDMDGLIAKSNSVITEFCDGDGAVPSYCLLSIRADLLGLAGE